MASVRRAAFLLLIYKLKIPFLHNDVFFVGKSVLWESSFQINSFCLARPIMFFYIWGPAEENIYLEEKS